MDGGSKDEIDTKLSKKKKSFLNIKIVIVIIMLKLTKKSYLCFNKADVS